MADVKLSAYDPESWLETIWQALACHRENSIPEAQDPAYDEEWSEICSAMAWIREKLELPDEVEQENRTQAKPVCSECGSADILRDAYAQWDMKAQDWVVQQVFDKGTVCENCEGETSMDWLAFMAGASDTEEELEERLYFLRIGHKYGPNIHLNKTEKGRKAALYSYVVQEWDDGLREQYGALDTMSEDQAIEYYFECTGQGLDPEFYELDEITVGS